MAVKINKAWNSIEGQRIFKGDKCFMVASVIEASKTLEVMDIPLKHLCIDAAVAGIAGMPVREFVAHMKMILDCDLSKPIIMDEDGGYLDGRHRIARALLEEHETIKVVRFEQDPDHSYIDEK